GLTLDSRQGMTNMSVGATLRHSKDIEGKTGKKENKKTVEGKGGDKKSIGHSFDLGSPTYTPQVMMPMDNLSLSFDFSVGTALTGTHPNMSLGAFFSRQKLVSNSITRPAYGYL